MEFWRRVTVFEPLYAIIAVWGVSYAAYLWRRRGLARLNLDRIAHERFGVAFKDLTPNKQAALKVPKPFLTGPSDQIAGSLTTTAIWVAILFVAVLALAAYRELVPSTTSAKQSLEGGRGGALANVPLNKGGALWLRATPRDSNASQFPVSDLQLDNVQLSSEYGIYSISGRVANKSAAYTLKNTELLITAQECEASRCTTIGEASANIYVDVPPGQARYFNTSVPFSAPLHTRGQFRWSYTVRQIGALAEETRRPQGEQNAGPGVAQQTH